MLRILVVDDHAVVREGLKRIVDESPGLHVCAEAADAPQALARLEDERCDVVVLDLDLPGSSGMDLLRDIKRRWPDLPVLVLSFHAEAAYGIPSLKAGANGYLMKESSAQMLVQAIERVAAGGRFLTPALGEVLARHIGDDAQAPLHAVLSEREYVVLRLIGSGLTVSQVADEMALSVSTVSTYRRRVLDKMGLENNAQLTLYAVKQQLVE